MLKSGFLPDGRALTDQEEAWIIANSPMMNPKKKGRNISRAGVNQQRNNNYHNENGGD